MRADRLGRLVAQASIEFQKWWRVAGPVRAGVALFTDAARTMRTLSRHDLSDLDAGVGARAAVAGLPGVLRVDIARGFRDGEHALSFVYEP
jgi:hypothetical protein